jgi:hypothetical protein
MELLGGVSNMIAPWWRKDKYGYPIEIWEGRPFKSGLRIFIQNCRKIIG